MKHIKKYESKLKTISYKYMKNWGSTEEPKKFIPFDEEYIKLIFADFLDDEKSEINIDDKISDKAEYLDISLFFKSEIKISKKREFLKKPYEQLREYKKELESRMDFLEDIEPCLRRLEDEYTDISFFLSKISLGSDHIKYSITVENKY